MQKNMENRVIVVLFNYRDRRKILLVFKDARIIAPIDVYLLSVVNMRQSVHWYDNFERKSGEQSHF